MFQTHEHFNINKTSFVDINQFLPDCGLPNDLHILHSVSFAPAAAQSIKQEEHIIMFVVKKDQDSGEAP